MRAVRSSLPVAMPPKGDQSTPGIGFVWFTRRISRPWLSQIAKDGLIEGERPRDPVTNCVPAALHDALRTQLDWFVRVRIGVWVVRFHRIAELSLAVETIFVSSGDHATSRTGCVWDASVYKATAGAAGFKFAGVSW